MSAKKSTRAMSDARRLSLSPCPFCHVDELLAVDDRHDGWVGKVSVSCAGCGLVGPFGVTEAEAAARWNAIAGAGVPGPAVEARFVASLWERLTAEAFAHLGRARQLFLMLARAAPRAAAAAICCSVARETEPVTDRAACRLSSGARTAAKSDAYRCARPCRRAVMADGWSGAKSQRCDSVHSSSAQ